MVARARVTAVPFYRKHGYGMEDDMFLQVGLPHRLVWKELDATSDSRPAQGLRRLPFCSDDQRVPPLGQRRLPAAFEAAVA